MENNLRERIEQHRKYYEPLQGLQEGVTTERRNAIFQVQLCDLALKAFDMQPVIESVMEIEEGIWFDPSAEKNACCACDANLGGPGEDNTDGKHGYCGRPDLECPIERLHKALEVYRKGLT